jgi:hypothetical protein
MQSAFSVGVQQRMSVKNIVCMKWGTAYDSNYVNNLYHMVSNNITGPFRVICFTDNATYIDPRVEVFPLPSFHAPEQFSNSAYRKKTLCNKDLAPFTQGERFLYLDLDILITGNLDDMFNFAPDKDFIICYNWTKGKGKIGNSSVTMMRVGPLQYIIDDLEANFMHYRDIYKTASQEYMSSKVIERYGALTFWPDMWCRSFQHHLMPGRLWRQFITPAEPQAETKIVVFHGDVNPPDALKGIWPRRERHAFWKKWAKTIRPTPWIKKYWLIQNS